jgi:carbamoyltransferase
MLIMYSTILYMMFAKMLILVYNNKIFLDLKMRILGISPAHDASVCVLNNGEVEFFFKEERYSEIKKDNLPFLSIVKVYENLKGKIDRCVIGSPSPSDSYFHSLEIFVQKLFKCPVDRFCYHHHLQHAALAFENSNFDKSLVFVIDRNGSNIGNGLRESETAIIARKNPYSLVEIYKNFWASSFGETVDNVIDQFLSQINKDNEDCNFVCKSSFNTTKVYETATSLISEHPLNNGKTMGLSSYGKFRKEFPDLFRKSLSSEEYLIPNDSYLSHRKRNYAEVEVSVFSDLDNMSTSDLNESNHELYADYAYHVQTQTQKEILNFIRAFVEKTKIKNVVLTGGYAMNIVANSFYVKELPDVNFFFEPMADDTGNSIGASILLYKQISNDLNNHKIKNTFIHGVKHSLNGIDGKDCSVLDIVELLKNQKSVAVFNGLSESGQRALGNRSILFDARNKNAKDLVNKIKKREWYRPFAAIVLEEDCNVYFDMLGLEKSEYMTNSFDVMNEYKDKLPGIVHVDGSCRVQTIDKNSHLYELIIQFKKETGVGLLLNTSFNLSGYPLVETPEQAIKTLYESDLDHVWFPEIKKVL